MLPDRTRNGRNGSGVGDDSMTDGESWISEDGSVLEGSSSEVSTLCPTQLPPPRTVEAARKLLRRLCAVSRLRHLEVKGLVLGLGGSCSSFGYTSDGNLAWELEMTTHEFQALTSAMGTSNMWTRGLPVNCSQKLLSDIFALLDGFGTVVEEVVALCEKLREAQTGERLPEASDQMWLQENITPVATKLAARLKHLLARSQVLRFDIDREGSNIGIEQ